MDTEQGPDRFSGWLREHFADVASCPLGERHLRLWRWIDSLKPGLRPTPRVEVWPRGGGKSVTAELGIVYVQRSLSRRFVLYASGTQDQADAHVASVASLFEDAGVSRAISRYGTAKGWRRNQLRTANGFNVASYGLDSATRGIKIRQYRPDLIVFDDIDSQGDTPRTVEKKIAAITRAIIPAGSADCAILFLQNLIHEGGVVAQLLDGRAGFLLDREAPAPEPAVRGLVTAIVEDGLDGLDLSDRSDLSEGSGRSVGRSCRMNSAVPSIQPVPSVPGLPNRYKIVAGEATWEGQPISVCEAQINAWGLSAFLREAQHEVKGSDGYFFLPDRFEIVPDAPPLQKVCLAWDLAATAGAGDYTASALMGVTANGVVYVLHVTRDQLSSEQVRKAIVKEARRARDLFPRYSIRLPQDPGQAGKDQAGQLRKLLDGFENVRVEPSTGAKAVRARGWADRVNLGNAKLLQGPWNAAFIQEHRDFREDGGHAHDDQIDAASDAFNELTSQGSATITRRITTHGTYQHDHAGSRPPRPWFAKPEEEDDEEEDD